MLEQEFKFYEDNKEHLRARFPQRFWVIVGKEVVGEFPSNETALAFALSRYQLGSFLIQDTERESKPRRFHSRVAF